MSEPKLSDQHDAEREEAVERRFHVGERPPEEAVREPPAAVRAPVDAVSSYLVRRPTLHPADALTEYVDLYRTAWPVHEGFVVGPFERVVSDFGSVIRDVNNRFGTRFAEFRPTPESRAAAFALVEEMNRLECGGRLVETHVGRPSPDREVAKLRIHDELGLPRTRALLDRAEDLHRRFLELAVHEGVS